ncbi:MAG: hypothetical protein JXR32_10530 [Anaerolineaceae bacterium]|nr:hypothetical protein [Anaerolineaceae bacterium]
MKYKFFNNYYILLSVIIPLAALITYCLSFICFSTEYLPSGVNLVFASRLWKYVLLVLVVIYLVFFTITKITKVKTVEFNHPIEDLSCIDTSLVLLPLTPVVQYVINNQDILTLTEALSVIAFFLFLSILIVYAFPLLLSIVSSTRIIMLMGLTFATTINSMALLSQYFSWYGKGSLKIQLLFFTGIFLITWLLDNIKGKHILQLGVSLIFISNTTTQLISYSNKTKEVSFPSVENPLETMVSDKTLKNTPNIYLLIYDAYVPNETMHLYGIDNSSQENFLLEQGFTQYPHTYSVGADSLRSMSRVFNVSTDFYGDLRNGVSGNGIVQNILTFNGYKTYGVFPSDFMFQGIGSSYDYSIPKHRSPSNYQLISAVLLGEFRFNLNINFNDLTQEQFFNTSKELFNSVYKDRVFIYMHSNYPNHSQNSGACLPNETDLFMERLLVANSEMRQDVELITENDPEAIVIVAGDHGPYLTKNCFNTSPDYDISDISRLDIQDRFGTFLAIRWPTEDFANYDDITVLQDIFPAVFAYLYQDEKILESKIEPVTVYPFAVSGASVNNGVINGGIDDGEPLYLSDE